jgi:type 1 glutamine amidotransferase
MFGVQCSVFLVLLLFAVPVQAAEPLRALLITGGCCHDYEAQKKLLTEGISARANVTWTIFHEGTTREHQASLYTNENWARGFDVVVHDECFGFVSNATFIAQIVRPHTAGLPAVMLHCSTHSYRHSPADDWRKLLGITSVRHPKQQPIEVVTLKTNHPVAIGLPEKWRTPPDELYEVLKVWPDCTPLAAGSITNGQPHPCIWVNTPGKARVFGTTLGHGNDTVGSPLYLDLVTRGLLWSCDKLGDDGKPKRGYGRK